MGNTSVLEEILVQVDNRAPVATLTTLDETTNIISQTLALSGRITETGQVKSGLAGLEVAFTEADFVISPTGWLISARSPRGPAAGSPRCACGG